ncbi:hypothetical protein [Flammeovirga sp. SubArs3]|uniref:hypothetical protein n=1 Tax=Flammeovirga sp. SubArs3 TaxID=2995316 RepID=UPI00248AF97A|nr:hypothetical protein [Flammeovirga sp. SubArs3]
MDKALATALVSVLVSIFTLIRFLITKKRLKQEFKTSQLRKTTEQLVDLRLKHYPRAFEISDRIIKIKGNQLDPVEINEVRKDLLEWKTGITRLIISNESHSYLLELHKATTKQTANGNEYAPEQVEKIWNLRRKFRGSLRADIGILHMEDENRKKISQL